MRTNFGPVEPGSLLQGRYTVVRALKRGGMGAVYEATDNRLGGTCAVKEMLEVFSEGDDAELIRRKFAEEASLLCQLRHPGIPAVRDYFQLGNICYIVMDLVHGANLEQELQDYQKLTGAPFPQDTALEVATQVLKILEYLHFLKPPVIHRDIKPANLIREYRTGHVKLVDFGLARRVEGDRSQTLIGTLGYCPIEQMQGRAETRSDLYALGATLYHLLSGEAPRAFQLPRLTCVPPGLADVIERATQPRAEDRYPDAVQMRQALQRLEREPEPNPPEPAAAVASQALASQLRPTPPTNWVMAAVAGLGLLLGGVWLGQRRAPQTPAVAQAPASAQASSTPQVPVSPTAPPSGEPAARPSPRGRLNAQTPPPGPTHAPPAATPRPALTSTPRSQTVARLPDSPGGPTYPKAYPRARRTLTAPAEPVALPSPTASPLGQLSSEPPRSSQGSLAGPDLHQNWPGSQVSFELAPEWRIKRLEAEEYLLAERQHPVAHAIEVSVTQPQWDFRTSVNRHLSARQKAGWRARHGLPRPALGGWQAVVATMQRPGARSVEFLLFPPPPSADGPGEIQPPNYLYAFRVEGQGPLDPPAALETLQSFKLMNRYLASYLR